MALAPVPGLPQSANVDFFAHAASVHNAHRKVKAKRTLVYVHIAAMKNVDKSKSQGERLAQARKLAGFEDAKSAATAYGWNYFTYSQHERGERGLRPDKAERYAKAFRVRTSWLLIGEGEMNPAAKSTEIPVYGYVGARERVDLIPGDDQGAMDEVQPLRAEDGYRAVIVRGNSMLPAYREGDALFFREDHTPIERLIGRDCIVLTADKGRAYVKRIMQGSQKDLFTLLSYAPGIDPLPDVKIERAFPIEWIRRR